MTVFIIGKPRHGKSTFGRALADALGVKYGETAQVVRVALANRLGKSLKALDDFPKEHIRPHMVEEGDRLCEGSPSYLVERLYDDGCRVIAGIRRKGELDEARRIISGYGDVLTVWVEREEYLYVRDNTEVTMSDTDIVVRNKGSISDLQDVARRLAETLR